MYKKRGSQSCPFKKILIDAKTSNLKINVSALYIYKKMMYVLFKFNFVKDKVLQMFKVHRT